MGKFLRQMAPALLACVMLAGCGGGDPSSNNSVVSSTAAVLQSQTATDGLAYFNAKRAQLGLQTLSRNARLDAAAQAHSDYQAFNNVISHYEIPGNQHFSGVCLTDDISDMNCDPARTSRLERANYTLPSGNYAAGEVISRAENTSGAEAADDLITAIYHRFVIFEPMFKEAGAGAATSASGSTYFTVDFATIGLDSGLGFGKVITYPMNGQSGILTSFSSDSELPDPVPSKDVVGYPVSVHADILYSLYVANDGDFSIRPRGGMTLPVQPLWTGKPGYDGGSSTAAIVPLDPLLPGTTYDVQFKGTMYYTDGSGANLASPVPVNLNWSFTTKPG